MPVATEAQIGLALRTLLNDYGFSGVKIIGYDHNWVDAANYPVQLVRDPPWTDLCAMLRR
jgi:hypothetical protein